MPTLQFTYNFIAPQKHPELIVFNGEAVSLGRPYFEPMEAVLREHPFDGVGDSPRIITEPIENSS